MNVKPRDVIRAMVAAALLAVGIATTISSGGGGGGGDGGGSTDPVPTTSDLLPITGDNAHDVSSALIVALGISFDISEITGGEITGQSLAGSTRVGKLLRNESLAAIALSLIHISEPTRPRRQSRMPASG